MDTCALYGFDQQAIAAYLQALELHATDSELADMLQAEVIAPRVEDIIGDFYDRLLRLTPARKYISSDSLLQRLRTTQTAYLRSFGQHFSSMDYFENRLRVGLAHARVGVPLPLYIHAYRFLEQAIYAAFGPALRADEPLADALRTLVRKIITLDMSLAAETYHAVNINRLQDSLNFLRREEDYLRLLADTDSLTGLWNHECGLQRLAKALDDARISGEPLCVLMADLDHFKQVNDRYGHPVGDAVLRDTAARLRATVRRQDLVSRYGGEEFMIVFAATPLAIAREVALRMLPRVSATPINVQEQKISITISLGLCQARAADTLDEVLQRADQALYQAKHQGRNQLVVAGDPSPSRA